MVEHDLEQTSRWSEFTRVARNEGLRSVVAYPMRPRGESIGAMSIFWRELLPVSTDDVAAVQASADMATIGILHDRTVREATELSTQLQSALRSRVVIEQAKGMLAERTGLGFGAAFEALRRYPRSNHSKLRDVAQSVISGELSSEVVVASQPASGASADR